MISHLISVAPMMGCTDRHYRYFARLIAPNVRLYTEMRVTQALIHGNAERLLAFDTAEKPVALQLGGNNPAMLAACAKMGEVAGYDEINLNVGCPSDRVSSGKFGACLMLEPNLVAACIAAMQAQVKIPVTVKCRIGVDKRDSYFELQQFIRLIADAGCKTFIIHARKAWLKGLSPKENREIPPLQYQTVRQIKQDFPHLTIILNGGLKTITQVNAELPHVDGVMLGRAAYSNPYFLAQLQNQYFPQQEILSPYQVVEKMLPYIEMQLEHKVKLFAIARHLLGLFQGQYGAAKWRRYISENAHRDNASVEVIERALSIMTELPN